MRAVPWALDVDSELNVVIPWFDAELNERTRAAFGVWLEGLLVHPNRPALMDAPNVFSARIPKTDIVVVWHLVPEMRTVRVTHIGSE